VDGGGREVAENCGRAAGQDGGEEAAVAGRIGVTDGVDAAVRHVDWGIERSVVALMRRRPSTRFQWSK
jgi:hypothetical protein